MRKQTTQQPRTTVLSGRPIPIPGPPSRSRAKSIPAWPTAFSLIGIVLSLLIYVFRRPVRTTAVVGAAMYFLPLKAWLFAMLPDVGSLLSIGRWIAPFIVSF